MRADPSSVTTSNSVPAEFGYRGGEFGELVIIYNPATNTNRIWAALNRDATVAGVTGQTCIAPGQYAFFILTQEDNRSGINVIAETGTTVVTVQRQSFRSRLELVAVMGGLYGGAVAGQYWVAVSGTAIKLAGAYTQARMDTTRPVTSGAVWAAQNDQGTAMVSLGAGANGNLTLNPSGNGTAGLYSSNGSTSVVISTTANSVTQTINSTQRESLDSTGFYLQNTTPVIVQSGTSDNRVALDTSGIILYTPAAGGILSSSALSINVPINNASVVAAGDIVEWTPNTDNRVQSSAAGSVNPQLGVCLTGGTGNAGGTVFARVLIRGVYVGLVADTAGVTAGQYGAAGATNANRLLSSAALTANSFCRILKTAAATVATTISLGLT